MKVHLIKRETIEEYVIDQARSQVITKAESHGNIKI